MVYITGDTQGFPAAKVYDKKSDSLIVCDDFGCVWDGSKSDRYWQKRYEERLFTTLFFSWMETMKTTEYLQNSRLKTNMAAQFIKFSQAYSILMRGEVPVFRSLWKKIANSCIGILVIIMSTRMWMKDTLLSMTELSRLEVVCRYEKEKKKKNETPHSPKALAAFAGYSIKLSRITNGTAIRL